MMIVLYVMVHLKAQMSPNATVIPLKHASKPPALGGSSTTSHTVAMRHTLTNDFLILFPCPPPLHGHQSRQMDVVPTCRRHFDDLRRHTNVLRLGASSASQPVQGGAKGRQELTPADQGRGRGTRSPPQTQTKPGFGVALDVGVQRKG